MTLDPVNTRYSITPEIGHGIFNATLSLEDKDINVAVSYSFEEIEPELVDIEFRLLSQVPMQDWDILEQMSDELKKVIPTGFKINNVTPKP